MLLNFAHVLMLEVFAKNQIKTQFLIQ